MHKFGDLRSRAKTKIPEREVMMSPRRKKIRLSRTPDRDSDPFDGLPDDLVICILSKLCSSSVSPSDFVTALTMQEIQPVRYKSVGSSESQLWCLLYQSRKLVGLCPSICQEVRSRRQRRSLLFSRDGKFIEVFYLFFLLLLFSESTFFVLYYAERHQIRFYCLENRGSGASLMAKAAIRSHAPSLYSLAVIQFNGSGGTKSDKDLRAGVALCARAAYLGHVDALRELGHCLQDGYGVRRNVAEGRRLLVQANARELATVLPAVAFPTYHAVADPGSGLECALLSDFGCDVPAPESHPANRFLTEWFSMKGGLSDPGLRMCSHSGCGRPETRPHEFRRCSVCGAVNYCSRGCQAHDWKLRHKAQCTPSEQWGEAGGGHGGGVVVFVDGHAIEDGVVQS
ncbi:hypothetical protein V2J09_008606 [Rumex salicifolius]